MAKINFLAITVFFVSLILIANAAEENASGSYNTTNETLLLNHSNDTDVAVVNGPIEINSSVNSSQNNLSNANGTEISNNTDYLNDAPNADNTNLSNALTAENTNISAEETQNAWTTSSTNFVGNSNEILAEASETLTADTADSAAKSSEEESSESITASFGVYLEIVG